MRGDDGESADTSHLESLSKHSCQLSAPGLLHMTWQDSAPGVCLLDFPPSTLLGFLHETLHTSAGSPGTMHLVPCPCFPNMLQRVNSRSEEQLRGRTLSQQWEIVVSGLILSSGIHVGKLYCWVNCTSLVKVHVVVGLKSIQLGL